MNKTDRAFLFELLQTPSPTGFEVNGQRCWARYVKKHADSVEMDTYGSTWATLKGVKGAPTLMIEAHADEIGFMIKQITAEGYLRLERVGGIDHATARGRRLDVLGDKGVVRGIIGNTAIHLRDRDNEKAPQVHELYADVGASNREDVAKLGLRVGHPAVYTDSVELVGENLLCGRALDNRVGGYIIARVMAELAKDRPKATVMAVNAVQEEIGGYGARMIAHRLKPDIALVLDVTHATDTPGIDMAKHGDVKLGGGPSIAHGTANHPAVVARLMQVAVSENIPIQHESTSRYTGTDTDSIFWIRDGIPSGLVSLPLRYMHSVVETARLDDIERVIQLMTAFAKSISKGDTFSHRLED